MASYASYNVPKNLLAALINVESGGNPNAVSPKGAQGLGQIMPATAKNPGFNIRPMQNDSPAENLRIAKDYLGALLQKYGGDKKLALAAYNAGPGAVDKAGGIPDFPETQAYVPKVLKIADDDEKSAFMAWKAKKADDKEREAFMAWKAKRQQPSIAQPQDPAIAPEQLEQDSSTLKNMGLGALQGAAGIGATILSPIDYLTGNKTRREDIAEGIKSMGADPESLAFKGGQLGTEIAGTLGVGGALGKGAKALGAAPKLVQAIQSSGFSSPGANMLTRMGAGALTGGATGALINPDNAKYDAIAGAILPPSAKGLGYIGSAIGKYASMPFTGAKNAATQLSKELDGLSEIPKTAPAGGKFTAIKGATPTAGMLSNDPAILKLEMNARVRNPLKFYEKDIGNIEKVYNALKESALPENQANVLQDILNKKTGTLRKDAYAKAMDNPEFREIMQDYVLKKANEPGFRASSGMPLLDRTKKALILEKDQQKVPSILLSTNLKDALINKGDDLAQFKTIITSKATPEDLYTLRKELKDKLSLKTLSPDELTNAAKSNRATVVEITDKIDEALDKSSNGLWSQYLSEHKKGMAPITQGRSFQDILDKFETSRTIPGTDIPQITPAALRKAVSNETYINLGKKGYVSTVDDASRAKLNDAVALMNAMENAKAGTIASSGSPTAPYLASLAKQGLTSATGGNMLLKGIEALNSLGLTKGQNVLDDALLNPNKLQKILDEYHKQQELQATKKYLIGGKKTQLIAKAIPAIISNKLTGKKENGR